MFPKQHLHIQWMRRPERNMKMTEFQGRMRRLALFTAIVLMMGGCDLLGPRQSWEPAPPPNRAAPANAAPASPRS
jgi:hypothetical protein